MCSSRNIHTTPPPPPPPTLRRATEIPRGGGDGGSKKEAGFFPGGLGKIGELLRNNSFSVEQAISYFTVTGVSKQVLLFAFIFYLRSAKCFFSWLKRKFSLKQLSLAHE